jgi:hypothetical protein
MDGKMKEPQITQTKNGWRVDLPDGDFCYQPSKQFAESYARRWQVAVNMAAKQSFIGKVFVGTD